MKSGEEGKLRKKNLSWKSDVIKDEQEDITAETSLLPDSQNSDGRVCLFDRNFQ